MPGHIQISVPGAGEEKQEILLAELAVLGFDGFEQQADRLEAYIEEENFRDDLVSEIIARQDLSYEKTHLPPRNWNAEWEKNFEPVSVPGFCTIRSAFHPPAHEGYDLVITPKMSFGTGHHATTYLMIEAMRELYLQGKTVLDFGTGTGLLAILAEKCGAAGILAIDNDAWSIDNARENIQVNGCSRIEVLPGDRVPGSGCYDLILANVNKNVIFSTLTAFQQHLNPDGVLIVSGFLAEDLDECKRVAADAGLTIKSVKEKRQWLCITLD